jgi:hypothetical protein
VLQSRRLAQVFGDLWVMKHGLQEETKRHDAGFPLRGLELTMNSTTDISIHLCVERPSGDAPTKAIV